MTGYPMRSCVLDFEAAKIYAQEWANEREVKYLVYRDTLPGCGGFGPGWYEICALHEATPEMLHNSRMVLKPGKKER